jgi:hypothetical protein
MSLRSTLAAAILVSLAAGCGSGSDDAQDSTKTSPFVASPFPQHSDGYGLAEAKEKGLIEYEVRGTGSSSGDALMLSIRRTGDQTIVVYVDMGTVFGPNDAQYQRMVATGVRGLVVNQSTGSYMPTTEIRLDDMEPKLYVVEAFCMDFNLHNPAEAAVMTPLAIDARSAAVLTQAKSAGLSMPGTQAALWIDRDHVTKEKIQAIFEASDKDIEDAFEMLKTMPPP